MMSEATERTELHADERFSLGVLLGIGVVMSVTLVLLGRVWWCPVGDWTPWSFDVWSNHNSQHLFDPYSLSHIQHGIGLYLILTLLAGRWLSVSGRTLVVALVEAVWEVAENTHWIINRYREATVSLDYFGDSILNSVSDYLMCLIGVLLARKTSWPWAVGIFVALEITSILWIRDSLLLNILMLVWPIDAIKQWQSG